ncbi:MAG: dihydropteroate synthase [Acidaminococcaceae bacterium]|nr:dihydropteroate synthase [Acidaminococcaceae bacterium]
MIIPVAPSRVSALLQTSQLHAAGLAIMRDKAAIYPLQVMAVRTPAANIIKQEMLSCGGECAVPMGAVTCSQTHCNIVLLGTRRQYQVLCTKLQQMNYFGLKALQEELSYFLAQPKVQTVLADGRIISYAQLQVMGIINVTPDSFHAASRHHELQEILATAGKMLQDGATILDIGGESSRPGADSVSPAEESARVVPVITAIKQAYPEAIISLDTYHSATAQAGIAAGADIINDISAGTADTAMLSVAAEHGTPIILMHMRGTPKDMQQTTAYTDVVAEVTTYLLERAAACAAVGLGPDKVILDPGIGFAKKTPDNLKLMQGLEALCGHGYPVLLAASRKTVIGEALGGVPVEQRLAGTVATSCQAVYAGANMVRVHDVAENVQAVRMLEAIRQCQ